MEPFQFVDTSKLASTYFESFSSSDELGPSTSYQETETSNKVNKTFGAHKQDTFSLSKDQTLADVLRDVPSEILTGCDIQEACRPDYKQAIFSQNRPDNHVLAIKPTKSVFHEEETIDPADHFYFESDHLALKGNKDYRNLLKVIVTLNAQRTQAIKDLDTLLLAKKQALEDPIAYVGKLQSGNLPEYPGLQKIAEIPEIDWSKYNIAQTDNLRPQTRHAKNVPNSKIAQDKESDKPLVRGRAFDETKPESFNRLWTTDEQRRLEELLIEYPPEEIEMRRWTKIANALGKFIFFKQLLRVFIKNMLDYQV